MVVDSRKKSLTKDQLNRKVEMLLNEQTSSLTVRMKLYNLEQDLLQIRLQKIYGGIRSGEIVQIIPIFKSNL